MIRALRRVSGVLPLTRWLTLPPSAITVLIVFSFAVVLACIYNAVHGIVALAITHIFVYAETRSTTGAATLTFVVSSERITTCKPTTTLGARVWAFARVKFGMAL